ncbi:MAG: hypothetical protein AB4041_21705 [Microcystaceae cyanobacterium]
MMNSLTLLMRSLIYFSLTFLSLTTSVKAEPIPNNNLDLSPEIIEESPTLQRWMEDAPNVLEEIRNDPSFRPRFRLGYSLFPSSHHRSGLNVGVEDILIDQSSFAVRGDYHTDFNQRHSGGIDLQYYVLPLGSYINVTPIIGYRYFGTANYSSDGLNLGGKLILPLSRNGAGDITLMQTFISPGGRNEVGVSTLSVGYAVTENMRLSTDIQKENSRVKKDSRVGIVLEWMP